MSESWLNRDVSLSGRESEPAAPLVGLGLVSGLNGLTSASTSVELITLLALGMIVAGLAV
jgi:hypothetical protein